MKTRTMFTITCIALSLLMPACTTVSPGNLPPGTITQLAVGTVTDAAILVVEKNPAAKPILKEISLRLDEILQGKDVTQAGVEAFIAHVDIGGNLTPDQRQVLGRAIGRVFTLLTTLTGTTTLTLAEPGPDMPADQAAKVRQVRDIVQQIKASIDATLL